jgi:hypothetical protein
VGDPCQPTSEERQATRALCRAIVKSVVEDAVMPLPIATVYPLATTGHLYSQADVEDLVMTLAQEVLALANELEVERRCLETWRATARQDKL